MQLAIAVPHGMAAGQTIEFRTPAGVAMRVAIPPGVPPGGQFVVDVPDPPPVAQAVAFPSVPQVMPVGAPAPAGAAANTPMGTKVDSTAAKHAECPICFEPLCAAPVGIFLNASRARVSNHYFRLDAAEEWLASGNGLCPLTRAPIAHVRSVPDLRADPDGWFRIIDIDGDGRLSRAEAVAALKAQLPCDNAALDAAAADGAHPMWSQWDADGSGYLERRELFAQGGLLGYVAQTFAQAPDRGPIPDMRHDKRAWFTYWDEDGSGALEKEEVVRALLKTLGLTSDQARVRQMRSTVEAVWCIFDPDGSNSIDRDEFLAPGEGLADTIVTTLQAGC